MKAKRVLVCGAGSIGRRHISNLLKLGADVLVWRTRAGLLAEIASDFPVRTYADLPSAIADADAVVVATATDQHLAIATEVLMADQALFIEKPLSHAWNGIEELRRLAVGKPVEVGCQFRAHPNLVALRRLLRQREEGRTLTYRMAMGHRLDAWRPAQDYRQGYSADAARGGGALLDLIHPIDLALWFFGPVVAVNAVLSKVSDLEIQGDDVANLLLTHESGVTGQIQLDMASPVHRCEVEVMTTAAIYRWSNAEGLLRRHSQDGETIADRQPEGFERNDLFLAHMRHFLKRLEDPELPPLCTLEDGVDALKVALGAREADLRRQEVRVQAGR
jgi:predicted dehydrogenase